MTQIIGLVQLKGGTGRSTLATNLAVELMHYGSVTLIDGDMPQGTSAAWCAVRDRVKPTLLTADNHRQLINHLENADTDYVVVDAPPRVAEITRAILLSADLTLIPMGASTADIWATQDLFETVNEAKQVSPAVDARVIWTKYRGYIKSSQQLEQEVHRELHLPEMKTKIGYRVAYANAIGEGLSVTEMQDKNARNEVEALGAEVKRILKRRK